MLLIAAQNGRTDIIDDLLLEGADVNHGNNHRNVALHLAAQNGWTEIARKLLRHKKIIVDRADLHANTPLHLAAQNGQIGVRHQCSLSAQYTMKAHKSSHTSFADINTRSTVPVMDIGTGRATMNGILTV